MSKVKFSNIRRIFTLFIITDEYKKMLYPGLKKMPGHNIFILLFEYITTPKAARRFEIHRLAVL